MISREIVALLALTRIGLHGLYGLVVRVLHLNCKLGILYLISVALKV